MLAVVDGTGLGAAVAGRDRDGTGTGAAVDGRVRGGAVVGAAVGRDRDGTGASVAVGRDRDGTGLGAAVDGRVAAVGLATGLGRAPPSANALAAATVPKTATPVTVTAMSRARFTGFEGMRWLQTAIMAPGVGTVTGKDAWDRNRLSTKM